MKIIVISNIPLDSNYASAINVFKLADGFSKIGHTVSIFCREPSKKEFLKYNFIKKFSLSENIEIKTFKYVKNFYMIDQFIFAFQVIKDIYNLKPSMVYARDYISPCFTSILSINTVVESHAFPDNISLPLQIMISGLKYLKSFRGLTTISPILRESFIKKGVPEKKIKVLYDCVDLQLFSRSENIVNSKNRNFTVLYSGHLYPYKGISTILDAAKFLPNIQFKFLGGNSLDIDALKQKKDYLNLTNVHVLGSVDFSKVPHYLFNSDLLILPPSLNHPSANFTSPVKLGEYLASRTPILASDIPALVNFLSEEEVFFFRADDPKSLADMIIFIKNNIEIAKIKSKKGFQKALTMSYESKAQKIIDLSNSL